MTKKAEACAIVSPMLEEAYDLLVRAEDTIKAVTPVSDYEVRSLIRAAQDSVYTLQLYCSAEVAKAVHALEMERNQTKKEDNNE